MATKIVDKLLPTTMVGSYPRPHWFKHQLLGRDIRVAFKEVQHEEAYTDAVATVIKDQENAGLDIVTDGNMWYDDYVGVIGSFCWYLYERIPGFEHDPQPAPLDDRRRPERGQGNPRRLGWRDQQRPGGQAGRRAALDRPLPDREGPDEQARQGVDRRRPGEPGVARLLQRQVPLQERQGPDVRALPHLQQGDEGAGQGRRQLLPDRGPGRVAAALQRRQEGRLQVDPREHRADDRRRGREDRLALLLRQRLGQRHHQRQLPPGLSDRAAPLLRHRRRGRVRPRLRQPPHGRRGLPQEPAGQPGHPAGRARHPHQRDRDPDGRSPSASASR